MLTIIFIVSLALIAIMIGWKMIEERRREKLLFYDLRKRTDGVLEKISKKTKKSILVLNRRNAKLIAIFFVGVILAGALGARRNLRLKRLKFIDSLRTRDNLKKKGSASFFLKNVSEYKGK
ncbi:MAG: hypothetical protein HW401_805 [Parcubacteria group bacterium]|nr:hypothetical protein [Parcubacteria group bacterium]